MIRKTLIAAVLLSGIAGIGNAQSLPTPDGKILYSRDILPILSGNCFHCHGPDATTQKAGLRLDTPEGAAKKLKSGSVAIVPGKLTESELIQRIVTEEEGRMPPASSQKTLKPAQITLLKAWVEQGGKYEKHWSFVAPRHPAIPTVKNEKWVKNPIDRFILARLEKEGLKPNGEADRYILARRISLDLTGLPPTLEMAEKFAKDTSPDAVEKYADQILTLPAYGERWASVWLDLARYADSNGYATDNARTIWKYRDWVIDSINSNQPFDRFTVEQIAGDMLPGATEKQILATAFHRNTLTNEEGGTSDEEFRNVAVVDRVVTTMQVWMGLTMGCAQCHNHKYDPISQKEFFRVFAIFNQTEDADRGDNSPLLTLITAEEKAAKKKFEDQAAEVEKELYKPNPQTDAAQSKFEAALKADKVPANIKPILKIEPEKRNASQKDAMFKYFRQTDPAFKKLNEQVASLRKQASAVAGVTAPIMKELPSAQQRKTKVHVRGNFLDLGDEVSPGIPEMFPPLPKGEPANRLTLAKWLVDRQNPLTARVAVNRYWDQMFGVGLTDTPDDFGVRGKMPNHPELLDWLSAEFQDGLKWDVKKLLKLMVTSATYRQASAATPALVERDPDNRLFARGPRFRVPAEAVRDQTLAIAGLLSPKMFGSPVRPPRPKLGLTAAFGGGTDWEASPGEDKYRRALYTQWRRTTPYPSMITFDAPSRNVCSLNRPRTNTPLQALVTMNDPVYVEAAQALARKMMKEGGETAASRVTRGFRLALIREPRDTELKRLVQLYEQTRKEYSGNAKEAAKMATDPLGALPTGMEPAEAAAFTVVANVILNLDELFARP